MTVPEPISTSPSSTTWPWITYTPGWTTTGSPIETWAIAIAARCASRGRIGIPRACILAFRR